MSLPFFLKPLINMMRGFCFKSLPSWNNGTQNKSLCKKIRKSE